MAHDVSGEVRKIIAEQLSLTVDKLGDDVTLDSLGADSLDRVEIVMNLEDHFSIHIDDTAAEKLTTVGQVVSYIQSLVKS